MTISPPAARRGLGVAAISALAWAAMLVPSSASARAATVCVLVRWSGGGERLGRGVGRRPCRARPRRRPPSRPSRPYWTPERMRSAVRRRGAAGVHGRDRQARPRFSAAEPAGGRQGRARASGARGQALRGPVGHR